MWKCRLAQIFGDTWMVDEIYKIVEKLDHVILSPMPHREHSGSEV